MTGVRGPGVRRSTFLRATAAAAFGAAGLAGTGRADGHQADAAEADALHVVKVRDLTGPGITTRFRMEATDLGIPVRLPDGRTFFVFGDTFEEARVGGGWWRSPVGLYSTTSRLDEGITWSGAVGGEHARQLWAYEHDNPLFSTVLPSDVILVGGTLFLHCSVHRGWGNVLWSEIWRSQDAGRTWRSTGARFPGDVHGGLFQLLTWALGEDGYVYLYSTGYGRSGPLLLHRVPADAIADPAAYTSWGHRAGSWGWGNPPTPVLDGGFGELCLRRLGGRWLLVCFDAAAARIDALVVDRPTADLTTAYRRTLIHGAAWGQEGGAHVAQPYGGYVIPGSRLDDLHLTVSQWRTATGWPYRVMQFRIRGLVPA
ncbi:DUF4185 domain-containing protein [Streptomyces yangpuensis]|uniref:DUF4185 domain-containing protein n=1 Tax=Streptomyces yangpuensis TaxID=1648182 RepID=A0ABY5PPU7_9ACTN|nr:MULTISPECIES: DUF4185 domain-containing protein [Streptomyces]UUY46154.1 DUF4185 domain-containing protein [Streptomyces yangpuensis]